MIWIELNVCRDGQRMKTRTGKTCEWQEGYDETKLYFEHILKSGSRMGSAPFRIFVETVALSMRNKEVINEQRALLLEYITRWCDSEFNKGVHDYRILGEHRWGHNHS